MISLPFWSPLLSFNHFYTPVLLSFGASISQQSPFQAHRESLCTTTMHGYWKAVMTSFGQELLGGHGFSPIPPEGLHAIISTNPRLLLPTKSMVAYARKQSKSAIF